jgi:DNA-binding NarL/FixJ family response regulator
MPPDGKTIPSTPKTPILVVDDHEIVREGLVATLNSQPDFEVVGTAASSSEAMDVATRTSPRIALIDLRLPDESGDELCRDLLRNVPGVAVVMFSTYINEDTVRRSLLAGAAAYVTKSAGVLELFTTIRSVADGTAVGDPEQAPQITDQLHELVAQRTKDVPVTAQDLNLLELAAQGLTYSEIGRRLCISEATVKFHVRKLKRRLGAKTKTDLIAQAFRLSLIAEAPEDGLSG